MCSRECFAQHLKLQHEMIMKVIYRIQFKTRNAIIELHGNNFEAMSFRK